ncbi:glycerophosphodiester phosphodiesterase [Taibaiella soli]|uniref:GP-PDE domain-containing protein n=1 Tax=Taibaiella soli TaxID=1649169 RepID=A0A2W2BDY0_9BACT|nr:glycerophosphodiester phosphodiesterase family protein [Taibaiella soli]PZF74469.1 hypothetical protein DN068_02490 [Taibaiella soli]
MRILILFLAILICAGCKKTTRNYDNISGGHISVIGHGGSGFSYLINNYPPNSWSSVTRAIEYYGAEGSEIDIQMTRDTAIFMYHDQNLEISSSCIGCLYSYDSAALCDCIFKSVQGQIPGDHLTPLQEIITHFQSRSIKPMLFFDVHSNSECVDTKFEEGSYYFHEMNVLNRLFAAENCYGWVHIQSGVKGLITYVHNHCPQMQTLFDYCADSSDVDFAAANGCMGVAGNSSDMSADLVKYAHQKGLKVQLYGGQGKNGTVDALNKAPDYYLADDIELVQNILAY